VRFDESATLLKSGRMAEWARFSQALALRAAGQYLLAIAMLDTFIQSYPTSVDLDRAKFVHALILTENLQQHDVPWRSFSSF